jgi:hypothetical protein
VGIEGDQVLADQGVIDHAPTSDFGLRRTDDIWDQLNGVDQWRFPSVGVRPIITSYHRKTNFEAIKMVSRKHAANEVRVAIRAFAVCHRMQYQEEKTAKICD